MLQRIQTVYLALATILIGLLFFFPLIKVKRVGDTGVEPQYVSVSITGVEDESLMKKVDTFYVAPAIVILLMFFLVYIITQYRNRALQIIAGRFALLVCSALLVLLMMIIGQQTPLELTLNKFYKAGSFLLIPAIVCIFLALQAIRKDEALVRAADRIR